MELGLPCPQRVVQLPEIAWDQYTSGRSEFERDFCDKKRKTRRLKLIFDKGIRVQLVVGSHPSAARRPSGSVETFILLCIARETKELLHCYVASPTAVTRSFLDLKYPLLVIKTVRAAESRRILFS